MRSNNGYGVYFAGDENILVMIEQLHEHTKTTELHTIVNCILIKLFKKQIKIWQPSGNIIICTTIKYLKGYRVIPIMSSFNFSRWSLRNHIIALSVTCWFLDTRSPQCPGSRRDHAEWDP